MLLAKEGLVSLKEVFTDGTKIESVASRYTFVWVKSIQNYKEKMSFQLEEMWGYAQAIADDEDGASNLHHLILKRSYPKRLKRPLRR